jgi:glyoxalase family protein
VRIPGIHHITAIASDPQRNLNFYTGVLGLRLIKLTVNFDDPGTYHFYFGDETGSPGSILTFFPWPGTPRGRYGTGQAAVVSFAVPSLEGWKERLPNATQSTRLGNEILSFTDPDGMFLELVAVGGAGKSITGFHSVTLSESGYESTARLLTETFGFELTGSEDNRFRYTGSAGNHVDLLCQPDVRHAGMGAGSIHHVAFRAETDALQSEWRAKVAALGYNVTPILDRQYFHSIYFREPGGVLFEIATDPPGFAIDEPADRLGTSLKLPPMYEPAREELEERLPKLTLPEDNHAR